MDSRDKMPSQHQSSVGGRSGNFPATGQQAYPVVEPGPLVDVDNYGGALGRQSNPAFRYRLKTGNNSPMDEFLTVQESRVNGFLQNSAQQMEVQRTGLQNVANHLSTTASNIGQTMAQWMGHPASERVANLYQELEKSYSRQVNADNHANWIGSTKASDDTIQSKWKQLGYNIRALSRSLAKCQVRRPQNDVIKNRLSMAVPRWTKLLANDEHKEFVTSAYLWAIVEEIIEEGSEIMGGDHGMNFKAIRAEFIGAAPEGDKPSGRGPTLRHVARWAAQDKPSADLLQEMKSVIDTALELDEMLMNSKAIFTICRPESDGSKNRRFDATEMEAFIQGKDLSSKTVVEFAISPMLIKMGNADGCNYDSHMVIIEGARSWTGTHQLGVSLKQQSHGFMKASSAGGIYGSRCVILLLGVHLYTERE
ncbi:hypothetical protein F52700_13484 [Fusarium sp. NRRL 52700]|nr:hypothetical protein F52700_13484 [Fusarium sp. NRRL 52700]